MITHSASYRRRRRDNGVQSQINSTSPGCIFWMPFDDQTISWLPITYASIAGTPIIDDAISGSGWTGQLLGLNSDNGGQILVHSVVGTISQGVDTITGTGWSVDTQNQPVYLNRGCRDIINSIGYMGNEGTAAVWNADMSLNIKDGGSSTSSLATLVNASSFQVPGTKSVFMMHVGRQADPAVDPTKNKLFDYGYIGKEHCRLFTDRFQYRNGGAPSSGYTDDGAVTPILSSPSNSNIVSGGLIDRQSGVIQHWIDGVVVGEERLPANLTNWTVVDDMDLSAHVSPPYDTHHYHASIHVFDEIPFNIPNFMLETKELVLAQTSLKGERALSPQWSVV